MPVKTPLLVIRGNVLHINQNLWSQMALDHACLRLSNTRVTDTYITLTREELDISHDVSHFQNQASIHAQVSGVRDSSLPYADDFSLTEVPGMIFVIKFGQMNVGSLYPVDDIWTLVQEHPATENGGTAPTNAPSVCL